jgi:hypothetical protein
MTGVSFDVTARFRIDTRLKVCTKADDDRPDVIVAPLA